MILCPIYLHICTYMSSNCRVENNFWLVITRVSNGTGQDSGIFWGQRDNGTSSKYCHATGQPGQPVKIQDRLRDKTITISMSKSWTGHTRTWFWQSVPSWDRTKKKKKKGQRDSRTAGQQDKEPFLFQDKGTSSGTFRLLESYKHISNYPIDSLKFESRRLGSQFHFWFLISGSIFFALFPFYVL